MRLRLKSEKLNKGCFGRNPYFVSGGDRKGIQLWGLGIIASPDLCCIGDTGAGERASGPTEVWF